MLHTASRREFLNRSGLALIAAGLWPGQVFAQEAAGENGEFDFIAVNDVHFTDERLCPPWFAKAFAAMRASAPKAEFVILSGDLTSENTDLEYSGLKSLLPLLKVPVHLTLGNHDVKKDGSRSRFVRHFPGRLNYMFDHRGWQFLSIDTVQDRNAEKTRIPDDTLKWLDVSLKKLDPRRPTILSTHFPLGYGLVRRPKNADQVLARLSKFNVRSIFNGHWHACTQVMFKDAMISTNRCCSRYRKNHDDSPLKGWYVCEARQGQVSRRFVSAPAELL
jgi:calcineurin-like phosphoesterase family protein